MTKKTLLLVFIHGFKGGDDTFVQFPAHLRALLSHALPKVTIVQIQYPKFETRGDLHECVARFREWLQNKVIDLEVANESSHPTIDPSVAVVLIGHSMGGIVAAETILSIIADEPIRSPSESTTLSNSTATFPFGSSGGAASNKSSQSPAFMFPYIQGVLAFDTPYLGISPGVVAHGAEGHWNQASAAYSAYSSVASAFGWGAAKNVTTNEAVKASTVEASKMLPAAGTAGDMAAAPAWSKWGRYAMFAGAAGAVAAGGAAAYMNKDALSGGWKWVGSHLEFVGCLARGEELKTRLRKIDALTEAGRKGTNSAGGVPATFGFCNVYNTLGQAVSDTSKWATNVLGAERTFCTIPKADSEFTKHKQWWVSITNDAATAETWAHMGMFAPKENPAYYGMADKAKELLTDWVGRGQWYQSVEDRPDASQDTEDMDVDVDMDGEREDVEVVEKP